MRLDVAKDLSDSAFEFMRLVWPVIKSRCGGGDVYPVESVTAQFFEKQLDILAGIDAWQVISDTGIRGIASRVQWMDGDNYWPSFTVRMDRHKGRDTEWQKRSNGIKGTNGFLRPALVVQAYVEKPRRTGKLNYVCMCRADELYALATPDNEGRVWVPRFNGCDNVKFAAFFASNVKKCGVRVFEHAPVVGRRGSLS